MSKIIFDVGANNGKTFKAEMERGDTIYAFEPTRTFCEEIRTWNPNWTNFHLIESAVSDFNGTANFNIGDLQDGGVSSLNEFSDHIQYTWGGRPDLKFTHSYEVPVTRLDTWIEKNIPDLDRIDYLHIDTQGTDLKVLQGLGQYIKLVKSGQIEVPAHPEVALYKGQHTRAEAEEWLYKNGFIVIDQEYLMNEYNLFFGRKP